MSLTMKLVTRNIDEAVALSRDLFYDSRLFPSAAHDSFLMDFRSAKVGTITVGILRFGCGMNLEIGGLDDTYGVSIPESGPLSFSVGHHNYVTTPTMIGVRSPIEKIRAQGWPTGTERLASFKFDRAVVESELTRMLGAVPRGPIRFAPIVDSRSGRSAEWASLARTASASVSSADALIADPVYAGYLSRTLVRGLLLACDHQFRDALEKSPGPVGPATVRRAISLIEEQADQHLSASDVAALVGVSERTLQRGFRDYLGTTPGRYLTRIRMDGAHRDLVAASPNATTVSAIASRWGFFHDGRFAASYRAIYGRTPSTTLGIR